MSEKQSTALSKLLALTAQIIVQVRLGQSLSALIPQVPASERGGVQALSFFCLRYLTRGEQLAACLLSRRPGNQRANALLELSLCLLSARQFSELEKGLCSDQAYVSDDRLPEYAPHTIVNEAVKAAAGHKKTQPFKNLINACLRRYLRESDELLQKVWHQESVKYAFPQWWIDRLRQDYPNDWQALLMSMNRAGPLSLRINRRLITRDEYLQLLAAEAIEAAPASVDAVILQNPHPVEQLPGFEQGLFSVQDIAAQQAARLAPLHNGQHVLDACAAPGGKAAHLLESADIHLTAIDIDKTRLQRITENLQRLKLPFDERSSLRLLCGDASRPDDWHKGGAYDLIVADVPCTASGVLRRHPDIKQLRQPSDIAKTADLQRQIVTRLWPTLRPGGHLLYMTCSVFKQENETQAEFFARKLDGAIRKPCLGQLLPGPGDSEMINTDGFFFALFQKQADYD